jgi:Arc/MetJ-type ribon-helix-helix transcriptional regulator
MTIQITRPEVEELINQRLQSGAFKDAEDVILQALRSSPSQVPSAQQSDAADRHRTLREVFAAVRGLADDIDFSRSPSTGRPVDLS